MLTLSVNWVAIVVAAIASMGLGFGWYMALGKPWMEAQGKTREQIMSGNQAAPFIWSALCQLVMAYFIAILTPRLLGETNLANAVQVAVLMWVGFVATSMITNHRYQGQKWALTVIDGGYLLGVLIVQGIVIGLFR